MDDLITISKKDLGKLMRARAKKDKTCDRNAYAKCVAKHFADVGEMAKYRLPEEEKKARAKRKPKLMSKERFDKLCIVPVDAPAGYRPPWSENKCNKYKNLVDMEPEQYYSALAQLKAEDEALKQARLEKKLLNLEKKKQTLAKREKKNAEMRERIRAAVDRALPTGSGYVGGDFLTPDEEPEMDSIQKRILQLEMNRVYR